MDDGKGVGLGVGVRVGIVVGRWDGNRVGLREGCGVGSFVGDSVGDPLGFLVGARLRHSPSWCITAEIWLSLSDANVIFKTLPSTSLAVTVFDPNTNLQA